MQHTWLACAAVALSASPLGVWVILRRMSLLGDGLAHGMLPGAAVAFLFFGFSIPALSIGSLLAGLLITLCAGLITRLGTLREDNSFAALMPVALAAGVLIVHQKGSAVDLMHLLFGSVFGIDTNALYIMLGVAIFTIVSLMVCYRGLVLECFDPQFLRSQGSGTLGFQLLILILIMLNIVAGFLTLGSLMVLGVMLLPATTAQLWSRQLPWQMAISAAIALIGATAGLLISYHLNLQASPMIVICCGAAYAFSLCFGRYGSMRSLWPARKHLQH